MKEENLIHIKFEYESALESKKDILSSEIDLLKIVQRLENYKKLRMLELDIKDKIEKKTRALKIDIGRLQNLLPPVKIPGILKPKAHKRKEEHLEEEQPIVIEEGKDELQVELEKIQKRLSSLQR